MARATHHRGPHRHPRHRHGAPHLREQAKVLEELREAWRDAGGRRRGPRFFNPRRTVLVISLLALVVVVLLWGAWYASQRTTVIEVFAVLNPPGPGPEAANLTPTAPRPTGLVSVTLEVPERFRRGAFAEPHNLWVPPGFRAGVYAADTPGARFFALSPAGVPFVSLMKAGKVVALPDRNGDGVAGEVVTFAEGLNLPHGLAWHEGWLYVAENNRVVRFRDDNGDLRADGPAEVVVPNLPDGGEHVTRTITFGPDGGLYVSVGSSCNICVDDPRRAVVLRFNSDGTNETRYARGLRNAVGLVHYEPKGELWATENGRDFLGDDLPPDEVDLVQAGHDYGWPYCYGDRLPDPTYNNASRCETTERSVVKIQAHSAPLGLRFYTGRQFPLQYLEELFIAFHGSWNRRDPTGYKVVRIRNLRSNPQVEDFVSGWLVGTKAWGRPVDLLVAADGSLLVSDDHAGAVYRIWYAGES